MKNWKTILLVFFAVVVVSGVLLMIPPIRERVVGRVDRMFTRFRYALFPPEEEVFVPQGPVATVVESTLQAIAQADTPAPEIVATQTPTTLAATATPGPTATPLPPTALLGGIRYEDQHGAWNYCAPATLSMALSYWGWEGDRTVTGKYLKPFDEDLNVMPYEMAAFVEDNTDLGVVVRNGGTLEVLKRLTAGGFPVVVEKGTMIRETTTGQITWMGHYNVVVGYDDSTQEFITRDSYYSPPEYPLDYRIPYDQLMWEWRGFNYVFVVIYSKDQESQVMELLGDWSDVNRSNQIAAEKASEEIASLSGSDQIFAWYNRGSSLVSLQDYAGAASAYDAAFNLIATLPEDQVPKKILRLAWYQTGPYFAYYYSGRYQDVINLADKILGMPSSGPYLEESFYWRARARVAIGDQPGAVADLQESLKYHEGFSPSVELLQQLGYSVP